ncbi:hypothetical protein PFICI_05931 [Pestalotiopsis fici W106-1]|uniref:Uncharacterized protein n=1 Tax=Pestalotiopsis fici (strain W106-1 / CGMCC3.15140) TaxID=1229662 RepID=W3XDC5_PESFW|nr:uncharacterized protein PFICI_05931 [Pestalotiopsis fici W106-1]ETS84055.1 hypothetical protein PFICI_05931 [Pestalotiopsis fici W106-1]
MDTAGRTPIACHALDKERKPLAGLRVMLECFGENFSIYEAYTSFDGSIDTWYPVTELELNPLIPVAVTSHGLSTCRVSFATADFLGEDGGAWPSVYVDVALKADHQHSVTLLYAAAGYAVEVAAHAIQFSPAPESDELLDQLIVADPPQGLPSPGSLFPPFAEQELSIDPSIIEAQPRRKRGRPRKHPVKVADPDAPKRKRGRPRKIVPMHTMKKESEDLQDGCDF